MKSRTQVSRKSLKLRKNQFSGLAIDWFQGAIKPRDFTRCDYHIWVILSIPPVNPLFL